MEDKLCKLCRETKPISDFYLCGGHLSGRCKKCFGEYQRNNQNRPANITRYSTSHREQINNRHREKYHSTLAASRAYSRTKRARLISTRPDYYREYANKWRSKEYRLKKYLPSYILPRILRVRFLRAISQQYKSTSVINLVGCSMEFLRAYLESKFLPGMNWENRGMKGWHIDHIIPCAAFDLTKLEDQQKCFHYTNLQPLWARDNLIKSNSLPTDKPASAIALSSGSGNEPPPPVS